MKKPDCYKCIHRRSLPGDAHLMCANTMARVRGNDHGIAQGWFIWQFNFDPIWLEECNGFESEERTKLYKNLAKQYED